MCLPGLRICHKESLLEGPSLAPFCKYYKHQNISVKCESIPATVLHQHPVPIHSAAKTSAAALKEVEAVVLDVEGHQVTAKHALEDFVSPREDSHYVPGRERDVEEESHPDT